LFDTATPDFDKHLPVGQVSVSSNGYAIASEGCPVDYPFVPRAENDASAPALLKRDEATLDETTYSCDFAPPPVSRPARRHAHFAWIPLSLLAVLGGGFLAYRHLMAPEPGPPHNTAANRPATQAAEAPAPAQPDQAQREALPPVPQPPLQMSEKESAAAEYGATADEQQTASAGEPAPAPRPPAASPQRSGTSAPRSAASERRPATAERRGAASQRTTDASDRKARERGTTAAERPATASERRTAAALREKALESERRLATAERTAAALGQPPIAPPRARPPGERPADAANPTFPAAADPPAATGATSSGAPESTRVMPKERPAPPPAVRQERSGRAPPARRQQLAADSTWLRRMRAELTACGKPGLFRADVCREATRWKYCHPDRWRVVSECAVETFRYPSASD
jgi:hypothetical protein